jgi:protocatechuate 3,4-dioxygenase beta subunit
VKIWHARSDGSYSGQTPSPAACLKDRRDAARHYFRGVRTADARGSVAFDTCFPGWYRGRTIHVHYTISTSGAAATSQLVFEQAIVDEVFATHPDYAPFGAPDTTNAADAFLRSGALAPHTLDVARMVDGAMLVSKQLVLSS